MRKLEPEERLSTPPKPLPTEGRVLLGVLVGGLGVFIMLLYWGVVPWRPSRYCTAIFCDPYHWQVLSLGVGFFCVGLCFLIPRRWQVLGRLASWGVLLGFLVGIVGAFLFE
ncbi:hypothetical protein QWZ03_10560 [Chitinimonas viridis]|uniref:Transmembrane protein n=1 Tax=Chitinimonas viridis TaxID=664880 RepID=A0ABT8B4M8_9NEIS|nr:hypothetical protein [Chitinimonas viridis]MDN3577209.1 hypothetical protein [Chitinimonas viridis]